MTSVPSVISELVERFERNYDTYRSGKYNETQLRREYLDPFFKALGWDIDNQAGLAERYKDVVHEDSIKIDGDSASKAPDYCFRIGGTRKFFVEAKSPTFPLSDNKEAAFQIRRYSFSIKLPISILTNFHEFVVHDCSFKPYKDDDPKKSRILLLDYKKYADEWEKISGVFSRDAILMGAFDKYAESTKGKKGTAEVDGEILKEIEGWREELAHNIARKNHGLSVEELNFAVARTIDRILFLRVCEDRGVEPDDQLKQLLRRGGVYQRLLVLFRSADLRYNSGLFHFQEEPGRSESPDLLTPRLVIDDIQLRGIISSTYYPECSYVWKVIPADILGQVYEQFLGKIIRLTKGHQAKVEDKPEVKKAGGVYYTPTYIVDYIVQHTVGKLLEGKTPKEAAKLRILDPACGSGSFLIGAYQHLLDWYLEQYVNSFPPTSVGGQKGGSGLSQADKKRAPELPIYQAARGEWRLSLVERKRILLDHIYGVDIDGQAVEVTKLSLLLKVLEGETHDTLESELKLRIRALPDLGANIKCGNSLIGTDFYSDHPDLSEDERRRINPFDWKEEFKEVFKQGGFDAVIGNPPWGALFGQQEIDYFRRKYTSTTSGTLDSYALFTESALNKQSSGGVLSFITPDTILRKDNHESLRSLVLNNRTIEEIIETGPVFSQVRDTWCLIARFRNDALPHKHRVIHRQISRYVVSAEERLRRFHCGEWSRDSEVEQAYWLHRPNCIVGYLADAGSQQVISKMETAARLGSLSDMYVISRGEEGSKFNVTRNRRGAFYLVTPAHVSRYCLDDGVRVSKSSLTLGKLKHFYTKPKIWVIRIQKMRWRQRIVSTVDHRRNSAAMKTCQMIRAAGDNVNKLAYLQGILASKLTNFWCENYLVDDMNQTYLEQLPIRTIDFSDKRDKARHDKMVSLVEKMLELNKDLPKSGTEAEQTRLKRQIAATDRQIDQLVYELYGLTEEEIRIVEGADKA